MTRRVPALFTFATSEDATLGLCDYVATESNVIDMTVLGGSDTVLYSMDVSHKPFSTTNRSSKEGMISRTMFGFSRLNNTEDSEGVDQNNQQLVNQLNRWAQSQEQDGQRGSLGYSYSLESLRKRSHEEEM